MAKKTAPRSFAQRLKAFAKDIPKQQNEIKKELARECVFQVVGDTPVDTGRARGGWLTGIDAPDNTSERSGPYGPSVHRDGGTSGSKTRGGNESLNDAYNKIKTVKPKQKIYLTNNVPYIVRLNEGWSAQAPANFFQIAIERAKRIITRQKIRYGVK